MKKFCLSVFIVVAVVALPAQGKRFITEKDLLKFTWVADPQISPDGSTVVFVRVTVNERDDRYDTSLFAVPSSGGEAPRRLTAGARDTAPRWAPDGKRIAFVRASERDGRTQPGQLYLLSMEGGEARALTELTAGADNPEWSPDGTRLAFTSATEYKDPKASTEARPAGEKKSDVQVVTRAVYRENGNPGYVDNERRTHIFTISGLGSDTPPTPFPKVATPTQLTDGEFSEGGIEWAPDGSKIYFVSTRVAEPYFEEKGAELYAVPAAGGAIAKIASIEGSIGNVSVSPDGSKIAFVGSLRGVPIRSYSQSDLWLTSSAPGSTPKNLTADYDFDIASGIGGDQAAPRGQNRKPIVWSKDGASVFLVSAEKGSSNLKRVSIATGKLEPLSTGEHDVVAFSAAGDASKIAATVSTQTQYRRPLDRRRGRIAPAEHAGDADHSRERRAVQGHPAERRPKRSGTRASTAGIFKAGSSSRRTSTRRRSTR